MGNLIVRFFHEGKNVGEHPHVESKLGTWSFLMRKYGIERIQKLEFDGNDYNIDFEIDKIQNQEIDWNEIEYPNDEIKQKVLELTYFQGAYNKLDELKSRINQCKFDDRRDLSRMADEAISIFLSIKESNFFDLHLDKNKALQNIEQTKREEINSLITYVKNGDSKVRKEKALRDAIYRLCTDINLSYDFLILFDLNKTK